ncbi:MAG: histidine kinase [Acidobacteriota bacterium]
MRSRPKRVALFLAGWTLAGLFFSSQTYLAYSYAGRPIPWAGALFLGLSEWYLWAALSPLLLFLARRYPLGRGYWLRSLLIHVPATFFLILVKLAAHSPIARASGIERLQSAGMDMFNMSLLTCWVIMGLSHALSHHEASQQRLQRALDLEARLAGAQLQLLKDQLQPHFLFNTLNSIVTLMRKDVEAAEKMLTQLSDLLRRALESGGLQEVSLLDELEFTKLYLQIQEVRFGDRLRVSYRVEPEVLDARVPSMILQPLAENAIRHGVEARSRAGNLEVSARRKGSKLRLAIRDDGPGIGLANIRTRLEKLYGPDHEINIENVAGGGLQVSVEIPFRAHSAAASEQAP